MTSLNISRPNPRARQPCQPCHSLCVAEQSLRTGFCVTGRAGLYQNSPLSTSLYLFLPLSLFFSLSPFSLFLSFSICPLSTSFSLFLSVLSSTKCQGRTGQGLRELEQRGRGFVICRLKWGQVSLGPIRSKVTGQVHCGNILGSSPKQYDCGYLGVVHRG